MRKGRILRLMLERGEKKGATRENFHPPLLSQKEKNFAIYRASSPPGSTRGTRRKGEEGPKKGKGGILKVPRPVKRDQEKKGMTPSHKRLATRVKGKGKKKGVPASISRKAKLQNSKNLSLTEVNHPKLSERCLQELKQTEKKKAIPLKTKQKRGEN